MEQQVKDNPGLVKRGGVVSNVDRRAFEQHIQRREAAKKQAQRVEGLEAELAELKAVVQTLLGNKKTVKKESQ